MGIFDFLKSIGKKAVEHKEEEKPTIRSMPTVKPDDEIYDCYDEVFKVMIADISGISKTEGNEILAIIKKSEGFHKKIKEFEAKEPGEEVQENEFLNENEKVFTM